MSRRVPSGRCQPVRTGRPRPTVVTSSLVWACCDDLGDRGFVADRQLVDHVFGFGGHVGSVGGTPDTGLTRRCQGVPWSSDHGVCARLGRASPRRRAHSRAVRQDRRSARSPRARGGRDGPHRAVDRRSVGRRGRGHGAQHAADQGVAFATGVGRRRAGDGDQCRLHAATSNRARSMRSRCFDWPSRRQRFEALATPPLRSKRARRRWRCSAARSSPAPARASG